MRVILVYMVTILVSLPMRIGLHWFQTFLWAEKAGFGHLKTHLLVENPPIKTQPMFLIHSLHQWVNCNTHKLQEWIHLA